MEIHGHGRANELANLLFGVQEPSAQKPGPKASASGAEPQRSDTVSLSQQGKLFQKLQEAVHGPDDPGRAAFIASIRDSIANNTYDGNGRKTGDALIRNVLIDSLL